MGKLRIIVTGGAGFIGSHVCEALRAEGHEVLALDDLSRGKPGNLPPEIPLEEADIRDDAAVERIFSSFPPDVVNHHAAQISVRDSVHDPVHDADINVIGSLRLLEACRSRQVKRFMFASTGGALYGEQEVFPAPEHHPTRPLSPYAVSKLVVEKYLFFFQQTYALPWTSLRYSNVYGPRQDPHGEAGVVAIFCQRMLAGEQPLINGDGEQTRDFVYVKDVARANVLSLAAGMDGAVNVATGKETSVNRVFRVLAGLSGGEIREVHGPAMAGEQKRSVLDPALARQRMKWEPLVPLEKGLELTVDYFREKG